MANIINGTDTGSGGLITSGDSSDELQLQTAETTAVTIDSSQNVGVGTGSPAVKLDVVGQVRASTGILFGSDTAAANALDDYEEGTFTPTLTGQTTAGTTTYSSQSGIYTKIGRKVTVSVSIVVTAATGTGSIRIGNLPFTSGGGIACVAPAMTQSYNWSGGSYLVGYVPNNTTFINVYSCSDDASWVAQQMVNESQYWIITATYFTA